MNLKYSMENISSDKNKRFYIPFAIVIAMTAFLFAVPSLKSGFIWDDIVMAIKPAQIGADTYSFFVSKGVYYRPFVHLSLVFDFYLWHLNAVGFHITNIFIHVANSILVFFLGINLFRYYKNEPDNNWISFYAFIGALFFAIHPIHVEAVAWISGRTDLLATFFTILAFLSFLIYKREGKSIAVAISSIFFLFGLFSKENAIALIGLALVFGVVAKMPYRRIGIILISYSVVVFIYFILRKGLYFFDMLANTTRTKVAFFAEGIPFSKVLSAGIGYYLEKIVFPFDLCLLPQLPQGSIGMLYLLAFFIMAIILFYVRYRLEFFLLLWIIIALLPSLTIMFSKIAWPLADRYLYLPSVGFCILFVLLLSRLKNKKIFVALSCTIFIVYSYGAYIGMKTWKDNETVWKDVITKNPKVALAHLNYGVALFKSGQKEKARDALLTGLKQDIIYLDQVSAINDMLGVIEIENKRYDEARDYLVKSITANPRNEVAYNNLGLVYAKMAIQPQNTENEKREFFRAAIINFENALRLSNNFIDPQFNLGLSYLELRQREEAEKYFNMVIESDPRSNYARKAASVLKYMKSSDYKNFPEKIDQLQLFQKREKDGSSTILKKEK